MAIGGGGLFYNWEEIWGNCKMMPTIFELMAIRKGTDRILNSVWHRTALNATTILLCQDYQSPMRCSTITKLAPS